MLHKAWLQTNLFKLFRHNFYNIKVKINKIIKTIIKKYITDILREALNNQLNIFNPFIGAPARSRTQNLLIRSQALYPVELQAHMILI